MKVPDYQTLLSIAESIAKLSAEQLLHNVESLREIDYEMTRDVKVKADQFLDGIIRKQLNEKTDFPIISEEMISSHKLGEGYQWIVDPLDGSLNFSKSIPIYCISISLWKGLDPLIGIIYDLNRDEIFTGIIDRGAWLNGAPIAPSEVSINTKAILATGFPVKADHTKLALLNFVTDIQKYKKIRLLGSAALSLAYVACGRVDCYIENNINIWDVAAGLTLIKSAGGLVEYTQPNNDMKLQVKASNPYIFK